MSNRGGASRKAASRKAASNKAASGKTTAALLLASRLQEYGAHTLIKDPDLANCDRQKHMGYLQHIFKDKKVIIQTTQTNKMPSARKAWDAARESR